MENDSLSLEQIKSFGNVQKCLHQLIFGKDIVRPVFERRYLKMKTHQTLPWSNRFGFCHWPPTYLARLLRNRIYLATRAVTFRERLEEMGLIMSINIMRTLLNVTKVLGKDHTVQKNRLTASL